LWDWTKHTEKNQENLTNWKKQIRDTFATVAPGLRKSVEFVFQVAEMWAKC
jgi:hypothetical protein